MEKSTKKVSEQSKSKNADVKSLKEGLKSSLFEVSVENGKENGVRVSTNGNEDLVGDDLEENVVVETEIEVRSGDDSENFKEKDSFYDAENEEVDDCVGISDGISLLVDVSSEMGREDGGDFNRREDVGSLNEKRENPGGEIREMSDSEKGEEDNSSDGNYEFCVGDFVWGKIKSYPWWPGQIYDSSDASDYALKVKPRDRLLVAYFDGTFAWCHPSQLKPFEKNFEDMSRQSSSKSFVNAVQNAVHEIGRLVELKMTCSCVPKESLDGLARPLAANSGVRPGVLVPEGGIAKLWNYLFGPSECLAELKHVAQVISINNMLEFTELKCWLSAFYRLRGGYQLALHHEPQPIPGLEDDNHDRVLDFSHDEEGPMKGPVEEESHPSMLQKCLVNSKNGQYQRRKQKSIAEIMEGFVDTPAKNLEEDVTKEGTGSGNPPPSSSRKMRKGNDVANAGSSLSSKPKRRKVTKLLESTPETPSVESDDSKVKRKTRKVFSSREEKKKNKVSHTKNDDGNKEETNASPVSVEKTTVQRDDGEAKEQVEKSFLSRERKRSNREETNASPMSVERKTVQRDDGEAKEQVEKSFLSRERKRSKYLSPPYTSINKRQTKKDIEEFLKVSCEAQVAERMTKAAGNLIGSKSPANLMCSDEVVRKKDAKNVGAEHEKSDSSNPEKMKPDQRTVVDTMKVKASAKDVISGIRSTAVNLDSLKEDSLDVVEGFVSVFRSSVYSNGSNYKIYNKSQPGRKRKILDSEPVSSTEDQNETEQKSPEWRSRRTKMKKNEAKLMKNDKGKSDEPILKQMGDAKIKGTETNGKGKSDNSELKQVTRSQDKKKRGTETGGKAAPDIHTNKKSDGKAPPASLYVTFGPTSSLPSKNDLIKFYSKFGSLNKEETEMFYNNHCARVVFLRSYDAEEALKSSQLASPFEASNCKFELRNSSSTSKVQKRKEISNARSSPAKEGGKALKKEPGSKSSIAEASSFNYVKQKLEMVSSVLADSDGKMTPELKSKLEHEVKDLLEKVNTVVGSSSS
ncbi:hypothetical protein WN944_009836 [Citrus x changshan-huyou]|uniref:PWWP domain-containing protein n=1 Tax=Citrus x changshan-huyou TaxID=2935761 RepID=A0AAP0QSD8_9ROSI